MGWGKDKQPENVPMWKEPDPRAQIRSIQVTDTKGHHYDVSGEDLNWTFNADNSFVHVFGQGACLASISDPARVIALDWEIA